MPALKLYHNSPKIRLPLANIACKVVGVYRESFAQGVNGLMFRIWIAAIPVWLSFSTLGFAQAEFRWKFRPGETKTVEMKQEIVHELNGQRTETIQTLRLRWHVGKVAEDGTADVEQSVLRLKMSLAGKPLIDTDDPEPQEDDTPVAARLRSLMRVRFTAETTPRGEIVHVRFEPEILDRLRDQLGLDEKTVRETFAQESLLFPIRALDVGATWTSTAQKTLEGIGDVITTTIYQYVGDEDIDGVTLSKFKITPSFQLSESARALAKQEGDSTLWFNHERGELVRSVSNQLFEIKKKDGNAETVQRNSVKTSLEFFDAKPDEGASGK